MVSKLTTVILILLCLAPFGWVQDSQELKLESVQTTKIGHHYFYQQYANGLPVIGSEVAVHVDRNNRVIAAKRNYFTDLNVTGSPRKWSADFARGSNVISRPRLVVLPLKPHGRLAWEVMLLPKDTAGGAWMYYFDAEKPFLVLRALPVYLTENRGKARVWPENPTATPRRKEVVLRNMDRSILLSGVYIQIHNAESKVAVPNRVDMQLHKYSHALSPDRKYNYPETDFRVPEAMAYYHLERARQYWNGLDFVRLKGQTAAFVNVAATNDGPCYDNAFYSRHYYWQSGLLVFGCGERYRNFGLDGDIYDHEYAHMVLDHLRPQLLSGIESVFPRSFHEGYADLAATVMNGNPIQGEYALRERASNRTAARNVENDNKFPGDVIDPELKEAEIHHTGLIAAGALWDFSKQIGSKNMQLILREAIPLLSPNMTFFELRDAMLKADEALNRSSHRAQIETAFARHGLGGSDPGQKGSVLVTKLVTARLDSQEVLRLAKKFSRGETIYVLAEYRANGVTPGYNLVAEEGQLTGTKPESTTAILTMDDVVNGTHRGSKGIVQVIIRTTEDTIPGPYKIFVTSRLGGQSKLQKRKSTSFAIE